MSSETNGMPLKPGNMVHPDPTLDHDHRTFPISGSNHRRCLPHSSLVGSLTRVDGHVYSLAARGRLLYMGSDGKNIRVWRDFRELSFFRSDSGLVKSIVISGDTVFTGHQDGKIRVWRTDAENPGLHRRAGTMPGFLDVLRASVMPGGHVQVRRHRSSVWVRHADAVSCLSMSPDDGCAPQVLYSASWDRTFKAWRVGGKEGPTRCLDSVPAHDDAVNAVAAGPGGVVYTGSADGTVKVWRREWSGRARVTHVPAGTLLRQESAVTSLAVGGGREAVYAGLSDGAVNFWEMGEKGTSWIHGGVLRGHGMAVLCLAAEGGKLVLSGSADRTICMWRREEGVAEGHALVAVLTGHGGPVKCLAVERERDGEDGERRWRVYSGSFDKTVRVWSVAEMPAAQGSSDMG